MVDSIAINGFKNIKNIELSKLSSINYLVGKNGSGKSSIVEFFSYIRSFRPENPIYNDQKARFESKIIYSPNNDINKYRRFSTLFRPDFYAYLKEGKALVGEEFTNTEHEFELHNLTIRDEYMELEATYPGTDENFFKGFFQDAYRVILLDSYNHLREFIISDKVYSYEQLTNMGFELENLNATSKLMNLALKVTLHHRPGERIHFDEERREIDLHALSSGTKILSGLKAVLYESHRVKSKLIIIEEPETGLHPTVQKSIPGILEEFIKNISGDSSATQIVVTTHSPFIISATADFLNQKVYLIDNGTTVDLNNESGKGNDGYSGKETVAVVAKMLGASKTDLGYPENYCIVEESSFEQLLDRLRDNGLLKNWEFISAGGNTKAVKLAARLEKLKQWKTLLVCNLWYADKYNIILDGVSGSDTASSQINSLKSHLESRLKILNRHALEDYYPDEIKKQFEKKFETIKGNHEQEGLVKNEFALIMADLILKSESPSRSFSNTFASELDFLIKDASLS